MLKSVGFDKFMRKSTLAQNCSKIYQISQNYSKNYPIFLCYKKFFLINLCENLSLEIKYPKKVQKNYAKKSPFR